MSSKSAPEPVGAPVSAPAVPAPAGPHAAGAPSGRSAAPRSRQRPWSLALRLTLWTTTAAFALVLGATGTLYWLLVKVLDREDDRFIVDQARIIVALLRDRPEDTDELKLEVEWEAGARQYAKVYVRLLDEAGRVLVETPGMGGVLAPGTFPRAYPLDELPGDGGVDLLPSPDAFYRGVAIQATLGGPGGKVRQIQVAVDRGHDSRLLRRYRKRLFTVLGVTLVLCAFVGHRIVRRGMRPLEQIAGTARRIRPTALDERIDPAPLPSELADLARTMNEMLDRLRESFDRLSRFSADIAHELRTPVNNLRGEIEVALGKARSPDEYRGTLESALEEGVRLSRIIDSLLFLARAEGTDPQIRRERIEVARELLAVREFYEAAAGERGVELRLAVREGLVADVDRTLFQRALGNLVENALAHTPPGGTVSLAATADGPEEPLRVEVADTGCGIPASHLPHVFDRFYRVDGARTAAAGGAGLGLAIVKGIAELHGGRVEAESEVGRGTRIRLRLPRFRELPKPDPSVAAAAT